MHKSGRKEGEIGDKFSVALLQQEFSTSVRATEPSLIHLKQDSSKHLSSPELGILELQSHSWPWANPPTLTLRSSGRESDASRPESSEPATGLELLESRAVMQSFGNHRVCCSNTLCQWCLLYPWLWRMPCADSVKGKSFSLPGDCNSKSWIFCWL